MYANNYYPKWYYPTAVTQDSEAITHVPWDSSGNFTYIKSRDLTQTKTVAPLKHIPNSFSTPIRNKTWYLNCNFRLGRESGRVNGIQLQLQMDRGSRIVDDTVQLTHDGSPIGENLANLEIEALKTYGNTWGLTWTDPGVYAMTSTTSTTFGVVLRFQSNFSTPHTTTPAIDFVRMRYTVEGEASNNRQEDRPNIGWTMQLTPDEFWILRPGNYSELKNPSARLIPGQGPGKPGLYGEGAGGEGTGGLVGGLVVDGFTPVGGGFFPFAPGQTGGGSTEGYTASGQFQGSFGFQGSTGTTGSSGFTGTTGYAGSTFGFIGSGFLNITSYNVIPTIAFLPTSGSYTYQAFLIENTNQIFYWDNVWILVAAP
jgi:hypothetical protein